MLAKEVCRFAAISARHWDKYLHIFLYLVSETIEEAVRLRRIVLRWIIESSFVFAKAPNGW